MRSMTIIPGVSDAMDFFPAGTRLVDVLAIGLVCLAVFHVMFVWWPFRLAKRGWRIVDYVYLMVGGVGLIGNVVQARQAVAGAV